MCVHPSCATPCPATQLFQPPLSVHCHPFSQHHTTINPVPRTVYIHNVPRHATLLHSTTLPSQFTAIPSPNTTQLSTLYQELCTYIMCHAMPRYSTPLHSPLSSLPSLLPTPHNYQSCTKNCVHTTSSPSS